MIKKLKKIWKKIKKALHKSHWTFFSVLQLATASISGLVLVLSKTPWSHTLIRSHGFLLTLLAGLHVAERVYEAHKYKKN
jgi:arginine exporter protein ArgO